MAMPLFILIGDNCICNAKVITRVSEKGAVVVVLWRTQDKAQSYSWQGLD